MIKIQQKIFEINQLTDITVCWLPAHCDIILHDQADYLARLGAGDRETTPVLPQPTHTPPISDSHPLLAVE